MTREEIRELVRTWERTNITKDAPAPRFRTVIIHGDMSEPLRRAVKIEIERNPEGARPYGVECGPEVCDFEIESIGADGSSTMIPYHVEIVRAGAH
jgi:hypothetical protein